MLPAGHRLSLTPRPLSQVAAVSCSCEACPQDEPGGNLLALDCERERDVPNSGPVMNLLGGGGGYWETRRSRRYLLS